MVLAHSRRRQIAHVGVDDDKDEGEGGDDDEGASFVALVGAGTMGGVGAAGMWARSLRLVRSSACSRT